MKTIVFFYFVLLIFLTECSTKLNNPQNFSGTQVTFGSGGGITGAVKSKTLLENGQLFTHNTLNGETQFLKKAEAKPCSAIFKQLDSLSLSDYNISHPGNIYYFIEVQQSGNTHRISWGAPDYKVPAEIQRIYQQLLQL